MLYLVAAFFVSLTHASSFPIPALSIANLSHEKAHQKLHGNSISLRSTLRSVYGWVINDHEPHNDPTTDQPGSFAATTLLFQGVMILCFGMLIDYEKYPDTVDANDMPDIERVTRNYGLYQDVHVMIFVGFGFLMTFLKKYSFSAVGYNMLISVMMIQWSILLHGLISAIFHSWHDIIINVDDLIKGDFAAGAVLISFGAVLGRVTPTQLIFMGIFELIFYGFNEEIGVDKLEVVDMGGSIFVHTFGAYFGLGVSVALGAPVDNENAQERNGSTYTTDMTAMIGTLFLWMFWPSFNGALCPTDYFQRERVVINTVLALSASCVCAFACSRIFTHEKKFDMVHIQNATLAGGVAVGSSSDLVIGPWGALMVGTTAGAVSVMGYQFLSPMMESKLGIFDTCGVHNLHGIPGIMGAIGGALSAASAGSSSYGTDVVNVIFPAREAGRTALQQGGYQFLAVIQTLGFSIIGGLITGFIISSSLFNKKTVAYHDVSTWELPAGGEEDKPVHEEEVELVKREEEKKEQEVVNLDVDESSVPEEEDKGEEKDEADINLDVESDEDEDKDEDKDEDDKDDDAEVVADKKKKKKKKRSKKKKKKKEPAQTYGFG